MNGAIAGHSNKPSKGKQPTPGPESVFTKVPVIPMQPTSTCPQTAVQQQGQRGRQLLIDYPKVSSLPPTPEPTFVVSSS